MGIFSVLVFSSVISFSYGLKCADISGTWQNELGSWMVLKVDDANRVAGAYYTAVETKPGAAAFATNITGLYSNQGDGALISFSVLFNHGASLTSWVGQCTFCEDKEVLHTSYVFRKHTSNHLEKWATVIVNQNTFFRTDDEAATVVANSGATTFSPVGTRSVVSDKQLGGLELSGKWKSNDKEEIEIFGLNGTVLTGKHHSTDLTGKKDGNELFTAVALISSSGKRIKSWAGYIYDTPSNDPKVLETSWLEHEFNPSCSAVRNSVLFGIQNFTRSVAGTEINFHKSETFFDKIRKFFSSMF